MSIPIKIYCPDNTSRHRFIFKLIFNELLGIKFTFCDNANSSLLNYSHEPSSSISCTPQGLLLESDVKDIPIQIKKWEQTHCFFKTSDNELPFDLFSAAFYLVSRYEEYLNYDPDEHNRFPARFSILAQHNLLEEPLVNQWALKLKDILLTKDWSIKFSPRKFEYKSTIDIDQAWKFKNKGSYRNITGTARDLIKGKWENLADRWPVLLGSKEDPFYNFDWQATIHKKLSIATQYFVLLGTHGEYDKNIKSSNQAFQNLIKKLDKLDKTSVGIHPSYKSNSNNQLVETEIQKLQKILDRPITSSRQHFLMHKMPGTYSNLIENGVFEDHTMGYSTHLGFRAGIAAPFNWFDLSSNKETELRLYPFCAMDITPLHYRGETPKQAIESLKTLMEKVQNVGGLFISLWHNESFSETERWKGWRKVYESLLEMSKL